MQIQCYPYNFDYLIKEGKVFIRIYAKLKNNQKIVLTHEHLPYFYAEHKENFLETIKNLDLGQEKVVKVEKVTRQFLGREKEFWRVYVNFPKAVPVIAKKLEDLNMNCYEKDILFVYLYLRDNNIHPMALLEVEVNDNYQIKEVIKSHEDEQTNWNILAVDIETYAKKKEINPTQNPILMVSFYGMRNNQPFEKVITWKKFPHDLDYLETVGSEKEMLERFQNIILEYDPDIITGYFTDGFDFPYLEARTKKNSLKDSLGLNIRSGLGNRGTEAVFSKYLHADVFKFIKYVFGKNLKTDSYSLDSVAKELLGHQKHEVNLGQLSTDWDNNSPELKKYCAYNLHDSRLTWQLCSSLFSDMVEFSKIVGVPLFNVIRMPFSKLVENYILKRAREFSVIAPNRAVGYEVENRRRQSIQGGFVYEPKPGLYKNLAIFDFKSLYPTIITAHNIGPSSFRCTCCGDKVPGKDNYWFCKKRKAFLPTVLDDLINKRTAIKKEIKEQGASSILESRSYALKILANSFYGYLAFFGAKWYCLEAAASTTAYARDYIQNTIEVAQKDGFKVCYADTDSCFLLLEEKTLDEATGFMQEINSSLPGQMELEFEGHFTSGVFVATKDSNKGAKKKYALMRKEGTLKIVGFEAVRRNWSLLAKEVQEKVLQLVLSDKKEEALAYVREIISQIKSGLIGLDKLVLKTQITRDLESYSSIGPHIQVAKKLQSQGEQITPGYLVKYIIGKGQGIVRERAVPYLEAKDYDANYYVDKQVLPAVVSILEVVGYDEDKILGRSSQVGLGKFF